jgi:L-2-hydroxycarboxylate dehydrogenase (NAD+)
MAISPLSDEAIAATWGDTPRFPADLVETFAASVFEAFGIPADNALVATAALVAADRRGIESHGVARIPYYAAGFANRRVNPAAPLTVDRELGSTVAFNGNNGPGLVQAPRAMARCIEKARETGICMATVRDSNHFGIAGYYALMAARQGLAGMAMTNSGSLAAPTFGARAMLGTNPIALAAPTGPDGADPFVMDLSTATVAWGKIEVARRARKPIPLGWAIDELGYPTTDPFAFGALMPLGGNRETSGHKGYALAAAVDILCGPLAGSPWSRLITDGIGDGDPAGTGHWFMAWRLDAFRSEEGFFAELRAMLDDLRATPLAPDVPTDRVLVPGEPEAANEAYNARHGIPVRREVLLELREVASAWGVPFILDVPGLDDLAPPPPVKADH